MSWLRRRRRRKLLEEPFPAAWIEILESRFFHYRWLTASQKEKLQRDLRIIIAEKNWEGCAGQVVDDEVKVTIAAGASLLVLGQEHDHFEHVESILVYPTGYVAPPNRMYSREGVVDDQGSARLGEAWYRGPVILSWADSQAAALHRRDGRNVVLHEFAHELDMLNGAADGAPPLPDRAAQQHWQEVMQPEFESLQQQVAEGRRTTIDPYGATNPAEFFAVLSEHFFERPHHLLRHHRRIYEIFRDYYAQDPAARLPE
jgi:Mlc titration factor MtfA (ptsG expression regulator)